jgi:type I restriction enzyme S subunit
MAGEWATSSLDECIEVKHGFAFKGEFIHDEALGDVLLTPGNFAIGGGFKADKLKYYDGPVPEEYVLKKGDLLVTMTDLSKQADTLGYPAVLPGREDGRRYLHNQRLGKINLKAPDLIDRAFLRYLLCSAEYRHEILASATGTTVKHTSPERIKRFQFRRPPLNEQRAIAHMLGTLDDKIELNRRMNETLEAMARALFKSWFVDFDPVRAKAEGRLPAGRQATPAWPKRGTWCVYALECEDGSIYIGHTQDLERRREEHAKGKGADWTKRHPPKRVAYWEEVPTQSAAIAREKKLKTGSGREWLKVEIARRDAAPCVLPQPLADLFPARLVDSELGKIPEGWEVKPLSDICTTQYGYTASAVNDPVGPKFLRVTDINKRNWVDWGEVPYCHIEPAARDTYSLKVGDLVVARMADPGKSAIVEEEIDAVFASYLVRLKTPSLAHSYYVYGFLKSDLYAEYTEGAKSGSVQSNMNAKVIVGARLVVPPKAFMQRFLGVVLPLRKRLVFNLRESRTLAALRDTLLPKLISGELRVKDRAHLAMETTV